MTASDRSAPRLSDATGAALRRDIERGRYDGTGALPGERQLARTMGVSRTTLRQAVADLVDSGLLVQRQGRGTFIVRPSNKTGINEANESNQRRAPPDEPAQEPAPEPVPSAAHHAENRPLVHNIADTGLNGPITSTREIGRGLFTPHAQEALVLGLGADERVCRLTRVILSGGRPVGIERAAAAARLLPDLDWPAPFLLGALAARGLRAARKVCRLRGSELDAADAETLDTSPRSPAIEVEEAAFLEEGPACAFTRATYRADRLDAVFAFDLVGRR